MEGIDLYSLYLSFAVCVNTFQGSFWRLQTDYTQVVNDISNDLWREYTAQAEKSQEIRDSLFPFLLKKNILCEKRGAFVFAPKPIEKGYEYGRFASAGILVEGDTTCADPSVDQGQCCNSNLVSDEQLAEDYFENLKEKPVELLSIQKWKSALIHLTKFPTFDKPKMVQQDNGWYVAPNTVSVIVLSFYKRPTDAVFAYTNSDPNFDTGAGGVIQYDKNKSTPLEWSNDVRNEFIIRLGVRYGIFNREQFLFEASKSEKK